MPKDNIAPGFMLIQSNRVEHLRDLFVAWTTRYPLAPLENEIILVESIGIAQWLRLALASSKIGIASGLETLLPSSFTWQVYRTILEDIPPTSEYDKGPLTWRIFQIIQNENRLKQALGSQAEHLTAFLRQSRPQYQAWQLACSLADIFDQYQVYRADWLQDWSANKDCLRGYNGRDEPIPEVQLWQPKLWRLLEQDIANQSGRSFLHQKFLKKIKQQHTKTRPTGLPRRVLVFGITSLPAQILEVLHAISRYSQIIFFVHNPCRHYWGDIVEGREVFAAPYRRTQARKIPDGCDENSLHIYGHPLLATWGKQGRDYIRLLDELDEPDSYRPDLTKRNFSTDIFEENKADSMLHCLQNDILDLCSNAEIPKRIFSSSDTSIRFHVAHSPQREVEILHDQLLHLFETARQKKQPLAPADVLVMVPDITVYAPHIESVFGNRFPDEAGFLPYRINDRRPVETDRLLSTFLWFLSLPISRFHAEEIMDLLHVPSLRSRFSIQTEDIDLLHTWINQTTIRWGLNNTQKQNLGLPPEHANTWLFGLERMLLGFAVGNAPAWNNVEPYPAVSGLEAVLAGQLSRLIERLQHYWKKFSKEHTPKEWVGLIHSMLEDFFLPADERDSRIVQNIQAILEDWWEECEQGDCVLPLGLDIVRKALEKKLNNSESFQSFFAGAINFATLKPMRAIPFTHIWLMGMDHASYPRKISPSDIDLMRLSRRPGDRSRRDDDQYLFLEALLSARQSLTISWVGKNITDNSEIPPSILVGQLRDQLDAIWKMENSKSNSLLEALTTHHPMKAYSRDYFSGKSGLFTYAEKWRNAHISPKNTMLSPLSPFEEKQSLSLEDLTFFLRDPAACFYAHRLQVFPYYENDLIPEDEYFSLDGLQHWLILREIIEKVFPLAPDGENMECFCRKLLQKKERSGELAHGQWGKLQQQNMLKKATDLFNSWPKQFPYPAQTTLKDLPFSFSLHKDATKTTCSLTDSLPLIQSKDGHEYGQVVVLPGDIKKKTKHLVLPWISHLAVNCEIPAQTIILSPSAQQKFQPLPKETAIFQLEKLLAAWNQGMNFPLPVNVEMGTQYKKDENNCLEKIGDNYEQQAPEAGNIDALQRCYPFFSDLLEHGFEKWADTLYTDLTEAIEKGEAM